MLAVEILLVEVELLVEDIIEMVIEVVADVDEEELVVFSELKA